MRLLAALALILLSPFAFAQTWTPVNVPGVAATIDGFDIKQSDNHWFVTDRTTGIWKTTDQGNTWNQVNSGIPSGNGAWIGCKTGALCGWTVVTNQTNGDLFANITGNPSHYYVSHDENTWTKVPEPLGFNLTSTGSFDGGLMPSPSSPLMLLGGRGCNGCTQMYSSNGGASGARSIFTPTQGETESNAVNGSVLGFGGEAAGFYTSTNGGANFSVVWNCTAAIGPTCHSVNDSKEIYAITTDGSGNWVLASMTGVWKSSGPASAPTGWIHLYSSSARSRTVFRDSQGNYWYGQSQNGTNATVRRSTDGGSTWPEYDTGIGTGLEAHRFVENQNDGSVYVLVENGSTNLGRVFKISIGTVTPPPGPNPPTNLTVGSVN